MFEKKQEKKSHIHIKLIVGVIALIIVCSTIVVAAADKNYTVKIVDGDRAIEIETDLKDASDILASQMIEIDEDDTVDTTEFDSGKGGTIEISRSCNIIINDHSKKIETLANGKYYEALQKNDVSTDRFDVYDQDICACVEDGATINIVDGVEIKVTQNGATKLYGVPAGSSVEEALKYAGIEYSNDDEISPKKESTVRRSLEVIIKKVEYKETKETVEINFETVKENTTSIAVGKTQVKTEGKNGLKELTYSNKYVDGKFDSKKVTDEKVLTKPTNKIVLVGVEKEAVEAFGRKIEKNNNSYVKTISNFKLPNKYKLNSSKIPTSYKYKLTGSATAYYGGYRTSTGKVPQPGYIAVNPKQIPYGTEMWIVSNDGKYIYGYAIAADTGGFASSSTTIADLYFNTYNECINFGRRNITIYIL